MKKIIIFGNSGSGKSTLARKFAKQGLTHLDLDTLAWDMNPDPVRRDLQKSATEITEFISKNEGWVIEGCYSDLIEFALASSNEIIFMNLPVSLCCANAKKRPWEPHKYPSKEAQDKNLAMLLDWIAQYPQRADTFSLAAHQRLFDNYQGEKQQTIENQQ